jgi:GMP synthase (glutamine-hydrolysing)
MPLFLDIEHPKALADAAYRTQRSESMEQRRRLFEELSGEPCRICRYTEFRREDLRSREVSSLITSGNRTRWEEYALEDDFAEFRAALEDSDKPMLGICAGHQLIGMLLGGECARFRQLGEGEADLCPQFAPGFFKEWGFYDVEVLADPLFAGFAGRIVVTQRHFWQLTRLPKSFQAIARNRNCLIQAMRHTKKGIYGVQFHPELHDTEHPDGRQVLLNFLSLAGS